MGKTFPLTVVIATFNEEENISRAINSIRDIASEILVIDSGSSDKTVEIAENLGAKVIYNKWENYPAQIQFGINKASNPYVFVIDADEEVSEELKDSIRQIFENKDVEKYACFQINRKTFYLGKFLNFAWQPEYRIRIFHKDKVKYEGFLHEKVICNGKVKKLKGDLYHYTYKDLEDQYKRLIKYSKLSAEGMYKNGGKFKLHKLILNPFWGFFREYFLRLGFLDGIRGFSVAVSQFFYVFLKYLFLWEIERKKQKDKISTFNKKSF